MGFFPSFAPGSAQGITPPLTLQSTGTNVLFGAGTTGDTFNRVEMDADGSLRLGTGAVATDTILQRGGINTARIQSNLQLLGGQLDVLTIGKGLAIAEGSNAKQGTAVLVAGTVTVANTSVTANSRIFLTGQLLGGTAGGLNVTSRVAGTSFTVTSTNAADTSTFAYEIIEPG